MAPSPGDSLGRSEGGRPSRGILGGRLSESDVALLRAALLEGEAAERSFRAWRDAFDIETIPYGQQRLLPLLQANMMRVGISDPITERFRGVRRYYWARNLRSMALAHSVFAALRRNEVPFIVLKGAAIVATCLKDRSLRPMDDIDVLVQDRYVAAGVDALTEAGLSPPNMDARTIRGQHLQNVLPAWSFEGGHQNFDFHWRALHLDLRPHADDRFWEARRIVDFDGDPIAVLDPAHQLLHIIAHAAQEGASSAVQRWPADAVAVIRSGANLSWDEFVNEAAERQLSAVARDALDFLRHDLDVFIPPWVLGELRDASTWLERTEARLRAQGGRTGLGQAAHLLLDFQDFRRRSDQSLRGRAVDALPSFLGAYTGSRRGGAAALVLLQTLLGHPPRLRALAGRDRHRDPPDSGGLPRVGDALKLDGLLDKETALIAGWGVPEQHARWTVKHEATVAWHVGDVADDLVLVVEGHPFLDRDMRSQDVEVWVNDHLVRTLSYPRHQVGLAAHVLLRGYPKARGVLYVTFLVRDLRSPAESGLSGDHRLLGFNLRELSLLRADEYCLRLPRIGETLDLSDPAVDQSPFEQGWGGPEATGRWTVGQEALLAWKAAPEQRELTLTCEGHAHIEAGAENQEVEVWVGDRCVAQWRFDERNRTIPSQPIRFAHPAERGSFFVRFRIRSPRSPAELGLSSDARALGLHIRRVTIAAGS